MIMDLLNVNYSYLRVITLINNKHKYCMCNTVLLIEADIYVKRVVTFLSASILLRSLLLSLIQRLLLLVWYIFSEGTQDLGRRSGGMVMPYSQPEHKPF